MRVVERATGKEFEARYIEGGYEITTLEGERYKKVKDSTFRRYFKIPALEKDKKDKNEAQVNSSQDEAEKANPETAEPISEEKREKMIEKIKKMLNLAENNPSMEEGLSAALQAHKLMAKYNIHEDDVTLEEVKDEILSIFSQQPHDSHLMGWRKQLGLTVATAFRCKCYLRGKDIVFRGYKADAQLALDVYLMLYNVGHKVAKKTESQERHKTGSAKGIYTSVATGFVKGVNDALSKQCTALLVITPKEVEEEWVEFSSNMKKSHSTLTVSNAKAYETGYNEGKQAVKSRALEKQKA